MKARRAPALGTADELAEKLPLTCARAPGAAGPPPETAAPGAFSASLYQAFLNDTCSYPEFATI